ncbi:MAG: hypothetical protein JXX28_18260 [Deltaproteobacteria bacterium]|nr:hypothetical protein [Deltaproteobacteria bacterium]
MQLPLARQVASDLRRGVGDDAFHTGSARFDGEWSFGSAVMGVAGLSQVLLAHPEAAGELRGGLEAGVSRLLAPDTRAFGTAAWGEDGLVAEGGHAYLGYLGVALGLARLVEPDAAWGPAHDALIASLTARMEAAEGHRLETYPGETYPPDLASLAGAVALHGRATGAPHPEQRGWIAALDGWIDPRSGLLVQSLARGGAPLDAPRGSGTGLGAWFTSFADRPLSERLYRGLVAHRRSVLGFGAVREYPLGTSGWGDIDSGPVLFGVSVSATGFALSSARVHRDQAVYTELLRTATLFGMPLRRGARSTFVTGGPLGDAILLAMLSAGPGAAR